MNNVDPQAWLADLLARIAAWLDALLPTKTTPASFKNAAKRPLR
jgi:IS66 C-terminal element